MKGLVPLLLSTFLAMSVVGCSDNAAKKPDHPAEKPNLGEPGQPPEMLPEADKQSAQRLLPCRVVTQAQTATPRMGLSLRPQTFPCQAIASRSGQLARTARLCGRNFPRHLTTGVVLLE